MFVAHVFNMKKQLIEDITSENIFGRVIARTHSIEFQKRGSPHMHIIVWLEGKNKLTETELVRIVSHTIPRESVLFAGVGGSLIGAQGCFFHFKQAIQAGLRVSWLVEKVPLRAASLIQSYPRANIYSEDVRNFFSNIEEGKLGYPAKGEVDTISSSPPCKGLSQANRNGGCNDEENHGLHAKSSQACLDEAIDGEDAEPPQKPDDENSKKQSAAATDYTFDEYIDLLKHNRDDKEALKTYKEWSERRRDWMIRWHK